MTSPLAQAIAFQNSVNPAQTGIAPTDVIGAYKLASEVAERNYEAKLKAQMGLYGGLAQLGSAGILGFKPTGGYGPLVSKLFGSGASATPAAGTAAGDAASAGIDTSGLGLGELSDLTVPAADLATPAAGSVAADLGGGAAGAGAADLGGSVAADLGATGAAGLGGSVAADLGATTAADIGAGAAAEGGADWLLSFLPFLLA